MLYNKFFKLILELFKRIRVKKLMLFEFYNITIIDLA